MNAWSIALDSIWHHKLRSTLTALGIVIGVFAVVTLTALGSSVKSYISGQFTSAGADIITVTPASPEEQQALSGAGHHGFGGGGFGPTPSTLTVGDARAIASATDVRAAAPVETAPGGVQAGSATAPNASVAGTTAAYFGIEDLPLAGGSTSGFAQGAILGHDVAATLFGSAAAVGQTIHVGGHAYPVVGVLKKSANQLDAAANQTVYIPVASALTLAGSKYVTEIVASADSSADVGTARTALLQVLAKRHAVRDYAAVTAGQMLTIVNNTLSVVTGVLGGIAAISLLVGGIGIMNIMLVTVTERVKEIGTRKAVGARDGDILVQFLVESVLLSVLGGAVGTGLSAVAGRIVGHAIHFAIVLTSSSVILAFAFSVAVGIVFGVFPAMNAARLMPAEELRTGSTGTAAAGWPGSPARSARTAGRPVALRHPSAAPASGGWGGRPVGRPRRRALPGGWRARRLGRGRGTGSGGGVAPRLRPPYGSRNASGWGLSGRSM